MAVFKKIILFLSVPMALVMLVTGLSFFTAKQQRQMESALAGELQEEFVPVFRLAVASDVHINVSDPKRADRLAAMFSTMYAYAEQHPTYNTVDALLLVGDITDNGADDQYEMLNAVIRQNLRPETEFVPVMGNHEFGVGGHEGFIRNMQRDPDVHTVVKGFHIIGLSPSSGSQHSLSQIVWLDEQLSEAEKDDPARPIFTMQHGHIWNTVYVSRSWSTRSSLALHAVYSKYPQVINFSGHSHGPINNPLTIWQNSYTTIGTGTMKYFEMEDDIGDETVPAGSENAAQYHIVEVDADNRVRVQPFNILTGEFFKTPSTTDDPDTRLIYQIDVPSDPTTYVYTSARKKTATAPYFDKGVIVRVGDLTGESATFTFPQAQDDVCVYGYRVKVTQTKHPLIGAVEKEVYAEYYFEPMPLMASVTVEGLTPGTEYTVSVTPLNVWLQKGEPITAVFTTPEA